MGSHATLVADLWVDFICQLISSRTATMISQVLQVCSRRRRSDAWFRGMPWYVHSLVGLRLHQACVWACSYRGGAVASWRCARCLHVWGGEANCEECGYNLLGLGSLDSGQQDNEWCPRVAPPSLHGLGEYRGDGTPRFLSAKDKDIWLDRGRVIFDGRAVNCVLTKDDWVCPTCTRLQPKRRGLCSQCATSRPEEVSPRGEDGQPWFAAQRSLGMIELGDDVRPPPPSEVLRCGYYCRGDLRGKCNKPRRCEGLRGHADAYCFHHIFGGYPCDSHEFDSGMGRRRTRRGSSSSNDDGLRPLASSDEGSGTVFKKTDYRDAFRM
jgi:hypothetical protein